MTIRQQNVIDKVYVMLSSRQIRPSGYFDDKGCWYAYNQDFINVRTPTTKFPYSELLACRTRKYVVKIALAFNARSLKTILRYI